MKIKTSELTGAALDWAVCEALGVFKHELHLKDVNAWILDRDRNPRFWFTRYWEQGGQIIERMYSEGLELIKTNWPEPNNKFRASLDSPNRFLYGPTPLIAAMRCFVASKLGDEVEVPDELS